MHKVDFHELKRRVSMSDILRHYNVQLKKKNGNTLKGNCPLPTHTGESKENFYVTDDVKWYCHSGTCKANQGKNPGGDIFNFVCQMEKCDIATAGKKIAGWFGQTENAPVKDASSGGETHIESSPISINSHNTPVAEESEYAPPDWLGTWAAKIDPTHPYTQERGIRLTTAEEFGIGHFAGNGSMKGRYLIPIHDEHGKLQAYAGRSLDASEPRYKLPTGFPKSQVVFNLHRITNGVPKMGNGHMCVVVEGFFDAIKMWQAGLPAVALMGCSISEKQALLLARFNYVIVMLDGDAAGRDALPDVLMKIGKYTLVTYVQLAEGKQPDSMSEAEISFFFDAPHMKAWH